MPYFITDSSPDCSGWATIKEDGEVMGCHTTKQQAIDQMVAISLAEEIEPGGERARPDELRIGDFVSWNSSGGRARGRIVRIVRDGTINVPDSDFNIEGTEDDPAALIRIFREQEDGWEATDVLVGHKFSTLTKIDDLRIKYKKMKKQKRVLPDNYRPSLSEDVPEGRACGNCIFYKEDDVKEFPNGELRAWCEKWDDYVSGAYYCNAWQPAEEIEEDLEDELDEEMEDELEEARQVNLTPPAYMRAAARRGLELNRQGFGGDGLTDKTKQEARDMADGRVSEDKWRRIAPWIARHLVDLDAPKNNNPNDPGYPGAGLVAHLLWGSGPSKRAAQRTLDYAQGVIDRLDAEEQQSRWSSVNVKLNKEEKENKVSKVERRVKTDIDFELRIDNAEADGMRFTGYAAVFNSDSEPLPFIERIMPGAFKRSLKARNEVKLFKNHNMDEVLASTRSKTLKLTEDSTGLLAEATLPDTTAGRDLAVLMKRGDVHAMSFGFSVPAKGDRWSNDGMTRELHQIRLHEVSIVTGFPAYEATTASVRSLDILASRTNVDADALADAMIKLEAGEKLADSQADLLQEVVTKLRGNEPNQDDLLELKRKQLDLLLKMV
jgi:HK97 family phage prohead protease